MKVVEFKRENWRDSSKALRRIADDIESGEIDECQIGVLAIRTKTGQIVTFGFGPNADDLQALALFKLGEQQLSDAILYPEQ